MSGGVNMSQRVIVVGGGIIGASTAYYGAKAGMDVILLESDYIAAGTSSACDQGILLQTKKPGPTLNLAIESSKMYEQLEKELDADIEYKKGGGLIIMENELEKEMVEKHADQLRQFGIKIDSLSTEEVRAKQPELGKHLLGATWCADDAKVNSMKASFELVNAAERLGAEVRYGAKVTRILTEGDCVIGVEVNKEKIYADKVILTTGVWTAPLVEDLGVELPIIPRRGHILVTEKLPPTLHSNILSGAYIAAKSKGNEVDPNNPAGVGLVIGQVASGNILIGGSREFVGFKQGTSDAIVRAISTAAAQAFPKLADTRIIRAFIGFRPFTADGLPIIGAISQLPGLYICAGHEGDGIALAPVSGRVITEIVAGKETFMDMSPFSPDRFCKVQQV